MRSCYMTQDLINEVVLPLLTLLYFSSVSTREECGQIFANHGIAVV